MESVLELQHEGRTLKVATEMIEFHTALPQPDPKWTYTDHAGHHHAYDKEAPVGARYPSLVRREGEPYWCCDCEDEHRDSWLECPLCGEKITPGTFVDTSSQYMNGSTEYLIDGIPVTETEGRALLEEIRIESETRERARALDAAKEKARTAEAAMRAEGLDEQQIQRVVNRIVHGNPEDAPE